MNREALVGCGPQGCKESDTTEATQHSDEEKNDVLMTGMSPSV